MPNQVLAKQGAVLLLGLDADRAGGQGSSNFQQFQVVNLSGHTLVVRGVYFDPKTAPVPLGQPEPSVPLIHAAVVIPNDGEALLSGLFDRVALDTPLRVRVAFILGGTDLELTTHGRVCEHEGARVFRLDEAVAGLFRPVAK
ncbi:hypothetical protein MF271_15245 [Deinococcus sp. KNUC1210]|uniref:hypothetical protein n=1 Tax=Deinococcus sp. KNUC1210 TaxID=2917691 RepID=UPI001EEFF822|nr:hypothetical protein [Deinococcus sp. KNUC1210]ULH15282.1 hypothetical protein MF271_15245 [Deinococcus sp. KNUC1210]